MIADANLQYLQEQIACHDDTAAYKALFVSFYNPLLRFAISFVKSREQAEEVVSDVFIHIWEKRRRLNSIAHLKVYLFIAVKNTALNYRNRQQRQITENIDSTLMEFKSVYFNPEQLMVTAEMIARIKAAIEDLPPRCKLIFKLIKEEDLKYREVAAILSISLKTVETQIAIALKKIGTSIQFDVSRAIAVPHKTAR